jgi:hypothetical protein
MKVKVDSVILKTLIDYLYKDEHKNWEEWGKPEDHIFHAVNALNSAYDAAYSNNDSMLDHWYDVQGADMLFKSALDAGFDLERVRAWIERERR